MMTVRALLIVGITMMSLMVPDPASSNTRTVEEVLSGDLVRIGESFVARLTGISVPPRDTKSGYRIYDFTKRELEGKVVKLFTWTRDNTASGIVWDENGHAFVQIYYGKGLETSFNEVLLKKGLARVDTEHLPEDLEYYLELEKEAREKGLGIWADSK
jgi:endonuclease YncB( thermonuclease family)